MKARGKTLHLDNERRGWWATLEWMPDDSDGDTANLSTVCYATVSEAQRAAEGYAKALGLEIEWEAGR